MSPLKERLEIRLSQKDLKIIDQKMAQLGIRNRSAYIRKMALDGYCIRMTFTDVKEIIRLLRINSNNLNQYARKANESGNVYEYDIRELQKEQKLLWQELRKILDQLNQIAAK